MSHIIIDLNVVV